MKVFDLQIYTLQRRAVCRALCRRETRERLSRDAVPRERRARQCHATRRAQPGPRRVGAAARGVDPRPRGGPASGATSGRARPETRRATYGFYTQSTSPQSSAVCQDSSHVTPRPTSTYHRTSETHDAVTRHRDQYRVDMAYATRLSRYAVHASCTPARQAEQRAAAPAAAAAAGRRVGPMVVSPRCREPRTMVFDLPTGRLPLRFLFALDLGLLFCCRIVVYVLFTSTLFL
jgi:hypothetical protein